MLILIFFRILQVCKTLFQIYQNLVSSPSISSKGEAYADSLYMYIAAQLKHAPILRVPETATDLRDSHAGAPNQHLARIRRRGITVSAQRRKRPLGARAAGSRLRCPRCRRRCRQRLFGGTIVGASRRRRGAPVGPASLTCSGGSGDARETVLSAFKNRNVQARRCRAS